MVNDYKVIDGVAFGKDTPDKVCRILYDAIRSRQRIRLFYGDRKTGKDWIEEYDTMGYVVRSANFNNVPLLVSNNRSMGGSYILLDSIVRITIDKRTVYQHPKYHIGKIEIRPSPYQGYSYGVFINGENHANFKTKEKAEKWVKFIKGESNIKG